MGHAPATGGQIVLADNLAVLATLADSCMDLIYIDPPFNTGKTQRLDRLKTVRDEAGDRVGFQGKRYKSRVLSSLSFEDEYEDYLGFLKPRMVEMWRVLRDTGSLYVHLDYREVHYVKVMLDSLFGRQSFLNEVIWAYDYGARSTRRWPTKHDNILVYVKDPAGYFFDNEAVDRIPYMAPGLVGPEKAARGKLPTDTWWHTIVPPGGKERTGYPTQKPLGILRRIVQASAPPNGLVADFFAGSGSLGQAAQVEGRRFLLVDNNPVAAQVMAKRFRDRADVTFVGFAPEQEAPDPQLMLAPR